MKKKKKLSLIDIKIISFTIGDEKGKDATLTSNSCISAGCTEFC